MVETTPGYKFIDRRLGYARLYDSRVAADYYRAMAKIEGRFEGGENTTTPPNCGQLLALSGTDRHPTPTEPQPKGQNCKENACSVCVAVTTVRKPW
jgi:hypothetical protein